MSPSHLVTDGADPPRPAVRLLPSPRPASYTAPSARSMAASRPASPPRPVAACPPAAPPCSGLPCAGLPRTSRQRRSRSAPRSSFIRNGPSERDRHDAEHSSRPGLVPVVRLGAVAAAHGDGRRRPGPCLDPHLPPFRPGELRERSPQQGHGRLEGRLRSEEHTSELQSRFDLVCRLLLEK